MKSQHPPADDSKAGSAGGPAGMPQPSQDAKNADPRLAHPAGYSGQASIDPRTGDNTNPDVIRVEADASGGLTGASSLVKKGPANVIEEEKERRERQANPPAPRLSGEALEKAPKSRYKVLHGSVRTGTAEQFHDAAAGDLIELNDQDAAHLLAAGAIEKADKK